MGGRRDSYRSAVLLHVGCEPRPCRICPLRDSGGAHVQLTGRSFGVCVPCWTVAGSEWCLCVCVLLAGVRREGGPHGSHLCLLCGVCVCVCVAVWWKGEWVACTGVPA